MPTIGRVDALLRAVRAVRALSRPPGAAPAGRRDVALVVACAVLVVAEGLLRPQLPYRWPSVALALVLLPVLLVRRTHPLAAVVAVFVPLTAASMVTRHAMPDLGSGAYVLLVVHALARWGSGREIAAGAPLVLLQAGLAGLSPGATTGDVVGGTAVLSAVLALGAAARSSARARARALEQAELLERERLARDLHDTVAHHMSAVVVRAQAGLAAAPGDPDAATDALRVVEAEASRALAEMRGLVRTLRRDEPAELQPGARPVDVLALADDGQPGPRVDVRVEGDLDGVAPAVGAAVFRIAQESVTNARRHARNATRVQVRVGTDGRTVQVDVRDDGAPAGALRGHAPGHGLVGMAERARLLGGRCEAGPDPAGGWRVTATLPRDGVRR
jgi:signal transduction histidine kinase